MTQRTRSLDTDPSAEPSRIISLLLVALVALAAVTGFAAAASAGSVTVQPRRRERNSDAHGDRNRH